MKSQSIYTLKVSYNFEYNNVMYALIDDGRFEYFQSESGSTISPIETQKILKERE